MDRKGKAVICYSVLIVCFCSWQQQRKYRLFRSVSTQGLADLQIKHALLKYFFQNDSSGLFLLQFLFLGTQRKLFVHIFIFILIKSDYSRKSRQGATGPMLFFAGERKI